MISFRRFVAESTSQLWYHLTNKSKFRLDPKYTPQDNAVAIVDRSGRPGLYITQNVERWLNGYHYWRPFVVELNVAPALLRPETLGRWGGERFIFSDEFSGLTIRRVIPLDAFCREEYGAYGWIEDTVGVEFDTRQPIRRLSGNRYPFRGYRYTGHDVRVMPRETVSLLKRDFSQFLKSPR